MIEFSSKLSSSRDPQLFSLNGSLPGALNKVRVPLEYRTLRENRADFNADPVTQCRHRPRNFDCFVQVGGMQDEITAHRFFGFGTRAIQHESRVRAQNNPAVRAERLRRFDLAPFVEPFTPCLD